MQNYFPMPAFPDTMPVDISFVFADEKPAGKHGFIRADGENLRFEDGTPAKFWGVNFNGGACFPSKEYAPKVARRLAQAGCNIVRFHQLDAEFGTPNIFAYTKGQRVTTTRTLDSRSLDCLDYLIYCLEQEGIYLYLDLLTYRQFKEGDGVVDAYGLKPAAKPWCIVDPVLIELQKEFATQLWTHYNPYTGKTYKDDPAFVLTEIVNESDLFTHLHAQAYTNPDNAYYIRQLREQFRDWLAENGLSYDWETCNLMSQDQELIHFKVEITQRYYSQMYSHLREIGVKIPVAGTNWNCKGYDFHLAHKDMDFADTHPYVSEWRWGTNRGFLDKAITAVVAPPSFSARMCLAGKPFFISEWDMTWPNAYRAEGPIYFAAVAALQNWSGLTVHTYSYNTRISTNDPIGRETTTPIGGSMGREGIWSTWNDWARFGMFYHAALMLRRGDVRPADKKVAVVPAEMRNHSMNAFADSLEMYKSAITFEKTIPQGYDSLVKDTDPVTLEDPKQRISCTGQLRRDLMKQYGVIDSPRTKVVYGKLRSGTGSSLELEDMTVTSQADFGVLALSSLTDAPIRESDNLLLTAMGRVRNTDQVCEGTNLVDVGKTPILAELVEAKIKMRSAYGKRMKVWGINAEGSYVSQMPTQYEDGWITFTIGDSQFPACYYLIYKE